MPVENPVDKIRKTGSTVDIRCLAEIFHKYSQAKKNVDVENTISLFTAIN